MRKAIVGAGLVAALAGCSGSPLIDFHAADYRETEAAAGDSQLLLNILRARDDLPIHFADLSVIHGSIQMTASGTATLPFANFTGSTTPSSVGPTLGAQTQPTFDVGTLDTQDFTRGILSQADPQIIKALIDQGVDPRIVLILFFSKYTDSAGTDYFNNLSCDPSKPLRNGECYNRVYDYFTKIDGLIAATGTSQVQANLYHVLTPLGGPLTGPWTLQNNLGDLRQLDPAKYKLIGKQVYAISDPRLALCYKKHGPAGAFVLLPLFGASPESCHKSEVIAAGPKESPSLSPRSTYDIIQFLGQVLRFQQEKRANRCLTLGGDKDGRNCDTGEVLFQVNAVGGRPVVATRYGDGLYTVNFRPCNKEHEERCDYSLQVLAILELLLNENKSAKDIIATPRVQVVP